MAKTKTSFNSTFQQMFDLVTANVQYDSDKPNGYAIKKKKTVKAACCHIILKEDSRGGASEPKVMIEDDDVAGTSHCVICDRTFPTPDINIDNLQVLKQAAGIINGALLILPWSNIGKNDARLAIECRDLLEKFNVLYESAVNDLATIKVNDVDTSIKSHVARL